MHTDNHLYNHKQLCCQSAHPPFGNLLPLDGMVKLESPQKKKSYQTMIASLAP